MQTAGQCVGYAVRSRASQIRKRQAWRINTNFGGDFVTFQVEGFRATILVAVAVAVAVAATEIISTSV
jgi:hypothetical protein